MRVIVDNPTKKIIEIFQRPQNQLQSEILLRRNSSRLNCACADNKKTQIGRVIAAVAWARHAGGTVVSRTLKRGQP
jgi:hypothetical protein